MPGDPRLEWLRLARLAGVGPVLVKRLLAALGSPAAILAAHPAALAAVEGIGTYRANQIVASAPATLAPAEQELARIVHDGLTLLTPDDPAFPPGFRNIVDPPMVLYLQGRLDPADALAIGIVGARQCSTYGREQARRFGAELAEAGLCIISGGARGIDSAAHLGALQANGRTIVVQGCGLRHTYPPENEGLYARIVKEDSGAILSEFPLDAPPTKENFPPRNRIIAALSLGILVVEANLRSGSLITARLAADDYGREVFALPGPITSPSSAGTHHLIKSGSAHLVDSVQDILENLGEAGAALQKGAAQTAAVAGAGKAQASLAFDDGAAAPSPDPGPALAAPAAPRAAFTSTQQKILKALAPDAAGQSIDELLEATGLPASVLMAELTILQIQSHIQRLPTNRFARKG